MLPFLVQTGSKTSFSFASCCAASWRAHVSQPHESCVCPRAFLQNLWSNSRADAQDTSREEDLQNIEAEEQNRYVSAWHAQTEYSRNTTRSESPSPLLSYIVRQREDLSLPSTPHTATSTLSQHPHHPSLPICPPTAGTSPAPPAASASPRHKIAHSPPRPPSATAPPRAQST